MNVDSDTYRVVIRQGLATIHDEAGRLVRVHRIDGGKLLASPGDKLMDALLDAIRATDGGADYLEACASVRAARESALDDPASKWREYEHTWLAARQIRESWEDGSYIPRSSLLPNNSGVDSSRSSSPPSTRSSPSPSPSPSSSSSARLPRSSVRRRLVAWGQR
jgi:hypothetical protein